MMAFSIGATAQETAPATDAVRAPASDDASRAPAQDKVRTAAAPRVGRPPITVSLKGGLVLTPADNQVIAKWDHDVWSSYMVTGGLFYNFPRSWPQLYFFAGGEFAYIYSYETLNSQSGASSLATTMYQVLVTGGLGYEPYFLGGDWGGFLFTSFELWGQKETRIDTSAYNRATSDKKTGVPVPVGVGFYYKITDQIRPFMTYETRNSISGAGGFSMVSLGLTYGF
jgi:hypothetical protein